MEGVLQESKAFGALRRDAWHPAESAGLELVQGVL